MTEEG
jgi:hypothetical protein